MMVRLGHLLSPEVKGPVGVCLVGNCAFFFNGTTICIIVSLDGGEI